MREKDRNSIEIEKMLPQFTTMNVIDGQAGLMSNSSLIFYSLTIDNILNIIVLLILAGVTIAALSGDNGILTQASRAKKENEKAEIIERIKLEIMAVEAENQGSISNSQVKTIAEKYGTIQGELLTTTKGNYQINLKDIYPDYIPTEVYTLIYDSNFSSRIKPIIYYENNTYNTDFNITEYMQTKTNGVTVYIAVDGIDTNSGLSKEDPLKTLEKALSIENVETIILEEGTYYRDTNYKGSVDITGINLIGEGEVIIDNKSTSGGFPRVYGTTYIQNITFRSGVSALGSYLDDNATLYCYGCKFQDAGTNGLTAQGGNYYMVNCEASNNTYDGFNYKPYSSTNSYANSFELNCKGFNNGKESVIGTEEGRSCNGSTVHDGCSIVRLNGEYYNNQGGNIADKSSFSYNINIFAHESTINENGFEYQNTNFWSSTQNKMWLVDCRGQDSDYDITCLGVNDNLTYVYTNTEFIDTYKESEQNCFIIEYEQKFEYIEI